MLVGLIHMALFACVELEGCTATTMTSSKYEYQSDFMRRYVSQGRVEGRAEGEAAVLDARGIDIPLCCSV